MIAPWNRVILAASIGVAVLIGAVAPLACAQSQAIMGIDGMVALHRGLFRNADPHDGINTFEFGLLSLAAGSQGRYHSFQIAVADGQVGGLTSFGRITSDSPEAFDGATYQPVVPVHAGQAALLDRAAFGALFDPNQYEVEVKFKPVTTPGPLSNQASSFNVILEQIDGFMMDDEAGILKRANERFVYPIGSPQNPINDWYASAEKDADGFATWSVPITSPTFAGKGFYHRFGDAFFREEHVVTGGGRVLNPGTSMYENVTDGPDFDAFGDAASSLDVPNGLVALGIESAFGEAMLHVDVRSVLVKKSQPDPSLIIRLDERSGVTHRFGTALAYNAATPAPASRPQDSAIDVGDGFPYSPIATDQLSRFDGNGLLDYLKINPRAPLSPEEGYSFVLRDAPSGNSFDGDSANVVVRARLSDSLDAPGMAQQMTIVLKDLDGNDNAGDPVGGDEYTYQLPLSAFNNGTFTTVTIPLSAFVLSPHVPPVGGAGSGPFGFSNPGDGSRGDFNLYELGVRMPPGGGLLRMDLDFLDVRVVPEPSTSLLLLPLLAAFGLRRARTVAR